MKHLLLACTLFLFASCNKDDKEKETVFEMTIASKMIKGIEPTGNVERDFLLAKWGEYTQWTTFAAHIQGFDYEEGYEYLLLVKKTPMKKPLLMDHYGIYSLIEIISMTKTESDIPAHYFK